MLVVAIIPCKPKYFVILFRHVAFEIFRFLIMLCEDVKH